MIKAVLVDDEEIALDVLDILLQEAGGVSVSGKFLQVQEAIEQLPELQPDIIFLDIEMPGMNGLDAAEQIMLRYTGAEIVFVTAYQEYALEAFEVSAFAYLLKPVSNGKLARTLERYRKRKEKTAAVAPLTAGRQETSGKTKQAWLYLNVLGSMELYDSARQLITWRTKKAKELFALLWHSSGAPVYRYRLLDELWPELQPGRAQALFHTTLYHLRNTLKAAGFPDMVMFGDERYWMRTDCIISDAAQLEAILQNTSGQDSGEDPGADTLALYRGDYFETEYYSWAEARRTELRSAYIHYLKLQLNGASGIQLEGLLAKLIELDPYTESHYSRLLHHLQEAGDDAGAAKLSRQMEQKLAEAFNPIKETQSRRGRMTK